MPHIVYYNYEWVTWELYHKVVFDGPNKIIHVSEGVTELDIKEDIYSAWKEWVNILGAEVHIENPGFDPAMRAVGGDPTVGGRFLGSTFFLINGWKIKPYSGNYRLIVNGNLFSDDGSDPFLSADGFDNNITVNLTTSNIVDLVNAGFGDTQSTWLDELHKIHGLRDGFPLIVDQSSRTAGPAISQTITKGSGPAGEEPVTITRDP